MNTHKLFYRGHKYIFEYRSKVKKEGKGECKFFVLKTDNQDVREVDEALPLLLHKLYQISDF